MSESARYRLVIMFQGLGVDHQVIRCSEDMAYLRYEAWRDSLAPGFFPDSLSGVTVQLSNADTHTVLAEKTWA